MFCLCKTIFKICTIVKKIIAYNLTSELVS